MGTQDGVLGVFYFKGNDKAKQHAARVRDAFVAAFGLQKADVPLLTLGGKPDGYRRGFHIEGDAPFALGECDFYTVYMARALCERGMYAEADRREQAGAAPKQ